MNVLGPGGEGREMHCYISTSTDGGDSFVHQRLEWDKPDTPKCNAPDVDVGTDGTLYLAATLAGELPQGSPPDMLPVGRVAMRTSRDGGASWSPVVAPIASGLEDSFATNSTVSESAKKVPWDGARVVVDHGDGSLILSGGYPAPPNGKEHSTRFYVTSQDGGLTWKLTRAFSAPGWLQRWDGHLVAAHGRIAFSYLADEVAVPGKKCLCVVFASGPHEGALTYHFVEETDEFDALVHYPPIAAGMGESEYAVALAMKAAPRPRVLVTADAGATWRQVSMATTASDVLRASRPAIAYAPDGTLVVIWRGYYQDGSYDMFAAAAPEGAEFRRPVRLSTMRSWVPTGLVRDYAARGDFTSAVKVGPRHVHATWTDWRTGMGEVMYGRVPIELLLTR
jgi:hypothetical protein